MFYIDEEEGYEKRDIRDLEFSVMNSIKQLRSRAYTLTEREIQIVKLVLCSSLYPQLAIGDEHNPHRKSNEIIFHIKGMCYHICLYSTSCRELTRYMLSKYSKKLSLHSSQ